MGTRHHHQEAGIVRLFHNVSSLESAQSWVLPKRTPLSSCQLGLCLHDTFQRLSQRQSREWSCSVSAPVKAVSSFSYRLPRPAESDHDMKRAPLSQCLHQLGTIDNYASDTSKPSSNFLLTGLRHHPCLSGNISPLNPHHHPRHTQIPSSRASSFLQLVSSGGPSRQRSQTSLDYQHLPLGPPCHAVSQRDPLHMAGERSCVVVPSGGRPSGCRHCSQLFSVPRSASSGCQVSPANHRR